MRLSSSERGKQEEAFIDAVLKDLNSGYWFVPFIGAGLSVSAGIPSAPELKRYLTYCFLRAAGVDPLIHYPTNSAPIKFVKPWNPRQLAWPKMMTRADGQREYPKLLEDTDLDDALRGLLEHVGKCSAPDSNKCAASAELLREMYGSLSDWRSAILLLSRLSLKKKHDVVGAHFTLTRTVPEASVIDSFFTHLVGGRDPTLGHRMIHALSPVLRADVILTTNFDDLIEKAFQASGTPLAVFEVPLNARLPVARLIHPQKTLLKINGGKFGVRADYTIDVHPTRADRWHFLSYLAGRPLDRQTQELPEKALRKPLQDTVALFFCGVSGDDDRTRALIDLAIGQLANLHIYWLCFTSGDEQQANRILSERGKGHRFKILRHPDHGLFLLQLYQRCTNTLPTSGAIVPSLWQVALPPTIPEPKPVDDSDPTGTTSNYGAKKEAILNAIGQTIHATGEGRLPLLLISEGKTRGAVTICSNLFYDDLLGAGIEGMLNRKVRRIWLNMDDVTEPAGVFLRLALIVAQISGDTDPISTLDVDAFYEAQHSHDFTESIKRSFASLALKSGQRLVVFINAQSGIGVVPMFSGELPRHRRWDSEYAITRMVNLLNELSMDESCGVMFVLMLRIESQARWNQATALDSLPGDPLNYAIATSRAEGASPPIWLTPGMTCTHFVPEIAARLMTDKATPKSKDPEIRTQALLIYLMTLFRIPRFPATLIRILDAFHREDAEIDEHGPLPHLSEISKWVGDSIIELTTEGGVRKKSGGLIWMDWEVKARVGDSMRKQSFFEALDMLRLEWLVARAYGRLLLASSDPLAAVECVYHTLHAVEYFVLGGGTKNSPGWNLLPIMLQHSELVFNTAKDLLKRRLSDQFADHSLHDMQSRCLSTIAKLEELSSRRSEVLVVGQRLRGNQPDLFGDMRDEEKAVLGRATDSLKRMVGEIIVTRSDLYLLEGSFSKIEAELSETTEKFIQGDDSFFFQYRMDVATARLCLRNYVSADNMLGDLWKELSGPVDGLGSSLPIQGAQVWLSKVVEPHRRKHMVLIARKLMYLRMHQSQANFLAASASNDQERRTRNSARVSFLERALNYCAFALEVLRSLPEAADPFVFAENARLRSHAGLCRGILALSRNNSNTPLNETLALARVQLIDAESYIEEFPLKDVGRARAVLELRRAELQLIEAGADDCFRAYRRNLRTAMRAKSHADADAELHRLVPGNSNFRVHLVFDAMRSLQRAEADLKKQPKSRWWWWLLIVLRMKTCEYLYCNRLMASLGEIQNGLPMGNSDSDFGDRMSSAGEVPIVLTRFLREDLVLMVRERNMTDPWQLARLTDSFSRTLFSMNEHAKRVKSKEARGLRIQWREPYEHTLHTLIQRLDGSIANPHLDNAVLIYSRNVVETAKDLVRCYLKERDGLASSEHQ